MRNTKKIVTILLVAVLAFSMTAFVAAEDAYIVAYKGCYTTTAVDAYQEIVPFAWCCWHPNHIGRTAIDFIYVGNGQWRTVVLRIVVCLTCGWMG